MSGGGGFWCTFWWTLLHPYFRKWAIVLGVRSQDSFEIWFCLKDSLIEKRYSSINLQIKALIHNCIQQTFHSEYKTTKIAMIQRNKVATVLHSCLPKQRPYSVPVTRFPIVNNTFACKALFHLWVQKSNTYPILQETQKDSTRTMFLHTKANKFLVSLLTNGIHWEIMSAMTWVHQWPKQYSAGCIIAITLQTIILIA